MNFRIRIRPVSRGFTLLEMSLVIMVLLALITIGMKAGPSYRSWKLGREASDILHTVYAAQRTFLADNPSTAVTSITHALLLPYMPKGTATFPRGTSLTGTQLNIFVGSSPPFMTTSGTTTGTNSPARYDPSGSNTDSLWDVGE